ncbi:MAG: sigma 54-interacting transcriptional regulator [Candidatus Adiutrix sp.]|jgi:DNA-binding NtrC family response regulator|nr:sigma 54-interacting transcriptional regulator [Candidatus Adiutrix sp.]
MTKRNSQNTLISWVGTADLNDLKLDKPDGPLASILRDRSFSTLHYFYTSDRAGGVEKLIAKLRAEHKNLKALGHDAGPLLPDIYGPIHEFMEKVWPPICAGDHELAINITSGSPAMCAIMIYFGRSANAELLSTRSAKDAGGGKRVMTVNWSFGPAMRRAIGESDEIYGLPEHERRDLQFKIAPVKNKVGILIQGETGSGKSYLARRIHTWSGRPGNFEELNCAAIATDANTFKSELFGHVTGAFTGASKAKDGAFKLAHRGTLFLDEVAELTSEQQSRLLSVVQEGTFRPLGGTKDQSSDALLIAAANKDLVEEVRAGRFRSDLYYRLAEYTVHLQPVRAMAAEARTRLLNQILEKLGKEFGDKMLGDEDREALLNYHWPGNIRQMEHLLKRLHLLSEGGTVTSARLRAELARPTPEISSAQPGPELWADLPLEDAVARLRLARVEQALEECGGENRRGALTQAAARLGLSLQTLNNYLRNGRQTEQSLKDKAKF